MAFLYRQQKAANRPGREQQRGVVAVEFAIVMAVFLTLVIGIFEIGRMMLIWNSAVEATTMGARLAAVCKMDNTISSAPVKAMDKVLPGLSASDAVQILYFDKSGVKCLGTFGSSPCYQVQVSLNSSKLLESFSTPLLSWAIKIPSFSTTLTTEELDSLSSNSVCN